MATKSNNVVQPEGTSEYLLHDSSRPDNYTGHNVFSGSLDKATQKLLYTAIAQIKGFGFTRYNARVFYKPTGYDGIARDTVRIEFSVVGSPATGKVATELAENAEYLKSVQALDAV